MFPVLLIGLVFLFFATFAAVNEESGYAAVQATLNVLPAVIIAVTLWFIIAYFMNTMMIKLATQSVPLARRENKRVYNMVENLCMASGMDMPQVNVIEDYSLNAFASGINKRPIRLHLQEELSIH